MNSSVLLSEKAVSRDNNFDFLRFFAASQVILYHTFALSGMYSGPFWNVYDFLFKDSGVGVSIFFVISGFLIIRSRLDTRGVFKYLRKRFFRLAPGLFVAVLFCVLIVGPIASSLDLKGYFSGLLHLDHHLPRVFEKNRVPYIVNGSLWTLKVEAVAYIIIAATGFLRVSSIRVLLTLLFLLLFVLDVALLSRPEYSKIMIGTIYAELSVRCLVYFMMGSLLYLYRDKVPLNGYAFLFLLLVTAVAQRTAAGYAVSFFTLPYLVVFFAYSRAPFHGFGRFGDFSYGLYIFAFPVQQTLLYLWGGRFINFTFFVAAFMVTLALAFLSWNLIEKPFLRLK